MKNKSIWAYLIFATAIFFIFTAVVKFSKDLDQYRLIFGFKTESRTLYLVVRLLIAFLFIMMGIKQLKKSKGES